MASLLTAVGLMRVSTGPAISVMLRGWPGCPACAITAAAVSTWTQGWQTATTCVSGPSTSMKLDQRIDIIVIAETAGRQADVAGIVPVGDVDVMVAQQGRDGVAQQRGEMAGHGRNHQHLCLRKLRVLAEAQQIAEGPRQRHLLRDRHIAIAMADGVDLVGRPLMA